MPDPFFFSAPLRAIIGALARKMRKPPTSAKTPPTELVWALGLSLLAWLHRLFFLLSNRDRAWPFTIFYEGDAETFFRHARAMLAGEVYDSGIPFHPPGFPTFLAGVHRLLGAGEPSAAVPHLQVKLVLAAVASLGVGLLYLLVRPYLGHLAALVTALLAGWHFGLEVIAIAPVSEGLYLTLLLLALLVWSRKLEHPLAAPEARGGPWWGLLLGLLGGVLCLVRAEAALPVSILLGIGLWGAWRQRQGGLWRALAPWLLVLIGWGLALVPWTLRNARTLEAANQRLGPTLAEPLPTFVPLTLYGPLNLALANHAEADGTFSRNLLASRAQTGQLHLDDPEHLRMFLHGDKMAREWILDHPGDYARLVMRKWAIFGRAASLGFTQWNWPGGLAGQRRPVDLFTPRSLLGLWLVLPALAGLVLCLRGAPPARHWAVLVLLLTAAGLFTTALFFGYVRQGLLLVPFWLTFVAQAVAALLERAGRRGLAGLAAVALLVLVLEGWGARGDRNFRASGTTLPGSTRLNPDLPVELVPLAED